MDYEDDEHQLTDVCWRTIVQSTNDDTAHPQRERESEKDQRKCNMGSWSHWCHFSAKATFCNHKRLKIFIFKSSKKKIDFDFILVRFQTGPSFRKQMLSMCTMSFNFGRDEIMFLFLSMRTCVCELVRFLFLIQIPNFHFANIFFSFFFSLRV